MWSQQNYSQSPHSSKIHPFFVSLDFSCFGYFTGFTTNRTWVRCRKIDINKQRTISQSSSDRLHLTNFIALIVTHLRTARRYTHISSTNEIGVANIIRGSVIRYTQFTKRLHWTNIARVKWAERCFLWSTFCCLQLALVRFNVNFSLFLQDFVVVFSVDFLNDCFFRHIVEIHFQANRTHLIRWFIPDIRAESNKCTANVSVIL